MERVILNNNQGRIWAATFIPNRKFWHTWFVFLRTYRWHIPYHIRGRYGRKMKLLVSGRVVLRQQHSWLHNVSSRQHLDWLTSTNVAKEKGPLALASNCGIATYATQVHLLLGLHRSCCDVCDTLRMHICLKMYRLPSRVMTYSNTPLATPCLCFYV